jgi:hypothetical protein
MFAGFLSGRGVGRAAAVGLFVVATTLAGTLIATRADAATINTYAFTQNGYVGPGGLTGSLQGTFTGKVEADGLMNLSGLTAFQMTLTINLSSFPTETASSVGLPSLFSFNTLAAPNPSGGNSTLAIVSSVYLAAAVSDLCIGVAAPFTCGVSGASGAYPTLALATTSFPQLTLLNTTAVTPLPAPVLLFGTALAGLGLLGAKKRRRERAA